MKNPLNRELYTEVQKKYSDFEKVNTDLDNLFRHIKYYFPKTKAPKVITLISEMDYQNKAIYADSLVIISLDLYLGKNHRFYEFPEYLKQNFEQSQIMPDIVSSFAATKIPNVSDKTLLSQMIYAGKELYLKDVLLPDLTDAEKIGYTPVQITWCQENESYMWRYFMEDKLLYSTDSKLPNRFINVAPFSKFYLEIDNDTPGRVGTWVGWQIVRSFMNNNDVTLQQVMQMDPMELFQKSKYKPKK
jgi:gliding motility-associated lipoprotein GldB